MILQSDHSNISLWYCDISESYSLWAGDDVAKVSVLPSAGELLHPHVDQLSFDLHVLLLRLLQLLFPRRGLIPLHPPLDLRVHLSVGPICTAGETQGGAFLRSRHRHLLPAVGDGNLALRRPALDVLQSDHFPEGSRWPDVDLWSSAKVVQVEVVQQLGEEFCVLC